MWINFSLSPLSRLATGMPVDLPTTTAMSSLVTLSRTVILPSSSFSAVSSAWTFGSFSCRDVKEQIDRATIDLENAQRNGDFERASRLRFSTLPSLQEKLPKVQAELTAENEEDGRIDGSSVDLLLDVFDLGKTCPLLGPQVRESRLILLLLL
jgi:hypothetical protein